MREEEIARQLAESAEVKERLRSDHLRTISAMAEAIVTTIRAGGTLYICGNGGSAADAQHMAGELVGRFLRERHPLPVVALTTDSSILTAVGNDYGFERVFERQVEALVRRGDCLLGISTSGNSPNVLRAVEAAKRRGARTLALTGCSGGRLADIVDLALTVPAQATPRIQEAHITVIHILCDLVEAACADRNPPEERGQS